MAFEKTETRNVLNPLSFLFAAAVGFRESIGRLPRRRRPFQAVSDVLAGLANAIRDQAGVLSE